VDFTAMEHIQASQWKLRRCVPQCVPVGSTPAGAYVGIYWQYGSTHPIPAQQLACVASSGTSGTAEGHGVDDVGQFNVRGAYNHIKLALTKQYVPGTGNPQENLGHAVQLRLTCCELAAALPSRAVELQQWGAPPGTVGFFGTWHVRTDNYSGDAEMCLWLPPVPVMVGHVITRSHTVTTTTTPTAAMTTTTTTMTEKKIWGWRMRNPFGPKGQPVTQTAVPMSQPITPVAVPIGGGPADGTAAASANATLDA